VIRRGFWLTTGAVTGIMAYRRVSVVGRRLSASLNPGVGGSGPRTSVGAGTSRGAATGVLSLRHTRRGAIRAARETYRFTRDVREGMALYTARQSAPGAPTLSTNYDAQPKDGH
jgi:hypothetical protein